MSLPQGLREEGRGEEWRDGGKSQRVIRKTCSQTPHLQNVSGSFPSTHTCSRLPFLTRTPLEPCLPVFLSYVWRFNSMQAWHARPPQPYGTLENQSLLCRLASEGPVQRAPLPACWVEAFKCHRLSLETCTEMLWIFTASFKWLISHQFRAQRETERENNRFLAVQIFVFERVEWNCSEMVMWRSVSSNYSIFCRV